MFRKPKRKNTNIRSSTRENDDVDHNNNIPDKNDASAAITTSHQQHETDGRILFQVAAQNEQQQDDDDDDDDGADDDKVRMKRFKKSNGTTTTSTKQQSNSMMHSYDSNSTGTKISPKDLVTSTADHHPLQNNTTGSNNKTCVEVGFGTDGIYRNLTKNSFHAGPIKAPTNIRTTARFDYQPDICKDYKETGFCGYGDTCIYLHDRGDTISGWQLELQYEEQQKLIKKQQQEQLLKEFMNSHNYNNNTNNDIRSNDKSDTNPTLNTDDNIPFACYICRQSFTNPIVTKCNHYFCEGCIIQYSRDNSNTTAATQCPICNTDTGSIFNEPTKLMTKVKRLLGLSQRRSDNTISKESWDAYYAMANHTRK